MLRRSARKRKSTDKGTRTVLPPRKSVPTTRPAATTVASPATTRPATTTVPCSTLTTSGATQAAAAYPYFVNPGFLYPSSSMPATTSYNPPLMPDISVPPQLQLSQNHTDTSTNTGIDMVLPQFSLDMPTNHTVNVPVDTPNSIESYNNDITDHIPRNIQEKIAKSEYINLASLLHSSEASNPETQALLIHEGKLVLQAPPNRSKIHSVEQWTTAFILFTSIYCKAHPQRLQELLKYMHTVRLCASRCYQNQGWKSYDEQYRMRKARDPSSSWANVDVELWLMYVGSKNTNNYTVQNQRQVQSQMKCFAFNSSNQCKKQFCHYSHTCLHCSGWHSVLKCPVLGQGNIRSKPPIANTSLSNFNNPQFRFPRNRNPNVTPFVNFTHRQPQNYSRQRFNDQTMGQRTYPYQY